jgi:hypothetical protein
MSDQDLADIVQKGWAALAEGNMDLLTSFYSEEMIFVLPGQADVITGRAAFRKALDSIGQALPPGFDIKGMRYCVGDGEVVNVLEWTSTKLPEGSHSAVLFRFNSDQMITEERWFVDTEQWKAAF